MQYNYKTEKLIQDGVDFEYLFADKQAVVKDMTGFEFDLASIVKFLKKETGDFTNQIPLAIDIDNQIYSIYSKWKRGQGKQDSVEDESMPMPQEQPMPTDEDNIEAIELMFDLLPDDNTQEAIELMIDLLPEKQQAAMLKKLKKALNN